MHAANRVSFLVYWHVTAWGQRVLGGGDSRLRGNDVGAEKSLHRARARELGYARARGFVAFCGILSYFVEFCRWWEEGRRAGSVVVRRVVGGGGWGVVCFVHGGVSLGCGLDGVVCRL